MEPSDWLTRMFACVCALAAHTYEKSGSARGSLVALLRGVQAVLIILSRSLCFSPDLFLHSFLVGLSRHFWRQGYATETAKALLRLGFDQLNLHRIFVLCDPENLSSAHVLEKVGMEKEGHFRERKFRKGKWHDELLYAIIDHK